MDPATGLLLALKLANFGIQAAELASAGKMEEVMKIFEQVAEEAKAARENWEASKD